MPTILQLRRGSTAENDAYTGSVGEITVDTTLSTVRLHDGSTAGGSLVGNLQKNIQLGITGDNEIDTSSGNLTIDSAGGTVTIDDNLNISGTTTVSGHILPDIDVTYDLGSSSFKFRDIYLSGTSINLGSATITASGSSIVLPSGSTISGGTGNLATESYVDTAVANVIDSAPGALDTLNELAAALGDDANYASTTTTALSNRLRIDTNAQGLTSTQKSNAITNLGLSTVATSGSYTDLSNTSSVVTLSGTQTLTNKTISSASNTITITESNISDLGSYITASSSDTLTNKSGNISQWTNNAGYLTSTNINTSTSGSNALITLTNSAGGSDSVTLAAGSNITISETGDTITIASTASGGALTIQDEGTSLTTDATTLNFVGSGVTASGTGSTKTITISGGGSGDLSAIAEDVLPGFDEVYDIGSSTYKWYDGFFTNSINIDTISLTNSSGTLSINSDVSVGSLLVDSLLLSENTITADASTALQYLGDKGVVEINNSNLDVREGDWIGVPVVETVSSVPPLTTGSEGIIRYNKDESRFEGYNAEGWASLGGLETNADGDSIITGNLVVSGDITSTSDETLKENIKSIEGALDTVTKLSGKMFTMKSDETQKEKVGFIAQEIEQHLPQVVSTDPNGIKSVSYGNVAALLVEAIKELNQKIEDLKK